MDDATLSLGADAGAPTAGPPVGEAFAAALAAVFAALPGSEAPAAADFVRQAADDLREDEIAARGASPPSRSPPRRGRAAARSSSTS